MITVPLYLSRAFRPHSRAIRVPGMAKAGGDERETTYENIDDRDNHSGVRLLILNYDVFYHFVREISSGIPAPVGTEPRKAVMSDSRSEKDLDLGPIAATLSPSDAGASEATPRCKVFCYRHLEGN